MLTDREIAIYSLGKTEWVNSIAETLGKGLDDKKYIESWNKIMKLLGIKLPLKDLEKIYKEFSEKMDDIVKSNEIKQFTSENEHWWNFIKCLINFKNFHILQISDNYRWKQ